MISETLREITANAEVQQDRLTLSDDTTDGTMYVRQSYHSRPLGDNETCLELEIATENSNTKVALTLSQMDALIDGLYNIQKEYAGETND